MASALGEVSHLPSGFNASETAESSGLSVIDGYYILVIMCFYLHPPCSHHFSILLLLGCGVLGFSLATIPKVNIDFVNCFDPIKL